MKKKYKIYETCLGSTAEIVHSYPNFKSLKAARNYIRKVLDPYYTGKYSVVETT